MFIFRLFICDSYLRSALFKCSNTLYFSKERRCAYRFWTLKMSSLFGGSFSAACSFEKHKQHLPVLFHLWSIFITFVDFTLHLPLQQRLKTNGNKSMTTITNIHISALKLAQKLVCRLQSVIWLVNAFGVVNVISLVSAAPSKSPSLIISGSLALGSTS